MFFAFEERSGWYGQSDNTLCGSFNRAPRAFCKPVLFSPLPRVLQEPRERKLAAGAPCNDWISGLVGQTRYAAQPGTEFSLAHAGFPYLGCATKIVKLPGTMLGRGCGCSGVAGGVVPSFAAARKILWVAGSSAMVRALG